jgi:hypothetical protein
LICQNNKNKRYGINEYYWQYRKEIPVNLLTTKVVSEKGVARKNFSEKKCIAQRTGFCKSSTMPFIELTIHQSINIAVWNKKRWPQQWLRP